MIRPRLSFDLRVLVLILLLSPSASAQTQNSPAASQTPHAAASKAQGADVLWYGHAPPGWGGVVTDMKLLAPGTGWAKRAGRLYWTTDNGANWRDITPPRTGAADSIFFLDSSAGWAANGNCDPCSTELQINLNSTTDGGATWSRVTGSMPVKDSGPAPGVAVVAHRGRPSHRVRGFSPWLDQRRVW